MKKFLTVLSILMIFIVLGCQQPVGNSGDTYITNTINIVWQGSFENPPDNPQVGWAYYNTSKRMSFVWDGEKWQVISQDGKSIVWKGELVCPVNLKRMGLQYHRWKLIYLQWKQLGLSGKAGRDGASGLRFWELWNCSNNHQMGIVIIIQPINVPIFGMGILGNYCSRWYKWNR